MGNVKQNEDVYSEAETVQRRESALKRMLTTPHQPHKTTDGEPKVKRPKSQDRAKQKST
jgi:hypothetical protein